jgi:hypothetical protein
MIGILSRGDYPIFSGDPKLKRPARIRPITDRSSITAVSFNLTVRTGVSTQTKRFQPTGHVLHLGVSQFDSKFGR